MCVHTWIVYRNQCCLPVLCTVIYILFTCTTWGTYHFCTLTKFNLPTVTFHNLWVELAINYIEICVICVQRFQRFAGNLVFSRTFVRVTVRVCTKPSSPVILSICWSLFRWDIVFLFIYWQIYKPIYYYYYYSSALKQFCNRYS